MVEVTVGGQEVAGTGLSWHATVTWNEVILLTTAMATLVAAVLGWVWTCSRSISLQAIGGDVITKQRNQLGEARDPSDDHQARPDTEQQLDERGRIELAFGNGFDDDELDAETLLNEALKPPRYDPLEFCNHIQAQVKKLMQKMARREIEHQMSEEQRQREKTIQISQLDAIFRLIEQQKSAGAASSAVNSDAVDNEEQHVRSPSMVMTSRDVNILREQMKLYIE